MRAHGLAAASRFGSVALVAVTAIAFGRSLGVEAYGTFASAMAAAVFLAVATELGLGTLLAREVAAALAMEGEARARYLVRVVVRRWGMVNFLVVAFAAVALGSNNPAWRLPALVAVVAVTIAGVNLISGLYRGYNRPVAAITVTGVFRPAVILFFLVGVTFVAPNVSVEVALTACVAGGATCIVASIFAQKSMFFGPTDKTQQVPRWRGAQMYFSLLAFFHAGAGNVEVLALSAVSSDAQAGLYRAAFLFGLVCQLPIGIYAAVSTPRIARLWPMGKREELVLEARQCSARAVLISCPMIIVVAASTGFILPVIFGKEFEGAVAPGVVLILGMLFYNAVGLSGNILSMIGGERMALLWTSGGYACNVAIIFLFGAKFGAFAAVLATLVGLLIANLGMHSSLRRAVGLSCLPRLADFAAELGHLRNLSGSMGRRLLGGGE